MSRRVVANLIGHTRTKSGLTIGSELNNISYQTWHSVSKEQTQALNLKQYIFPGEWNCTLVPRRDRNGQFVCSSTGFRG